MILRNLTAQKMVVGERLAYRDRTGSSDLVLPSANSTLRNRNFRRDSFDLAAAELGLKITPHNLRDTAASLALQAGALWAADDGNAHLGVGCQH